MLVYLFDPITGEFLTVYEAQESPLEKGEFILPEHCTDVKPLDYKKGSAVCFVDNEWVYIADVRGLWYDASNIVVEITELNSVIGGDLTREAKPKTLEQQREEMEVTAFQAHAAMARKGYYDSILSIINDPATPFEVKLAFNKAQVFKRLSPTVLMIAQILKLTDVQLDELFALAKTIEA